jgi:putrescine transport system substrate-binding protein
MRALVRLLARLGFVPARLIAVLARLTVVPTRMMVANPARLIVAVTARAIVAVTAGLVVALALLVFASPVRAEDPVLNVYNWTDYIDPEALKQFTRETGIAVRYDEFDSLETLEGKLLAGHSGYDIVTPSNEPSFSRLIRAGALMEIDRAKVPNWQNLDPGLMRRIESSDPGNRHGAIYLWGTIGLGMLPDKIHALVPDAPLDSWDVLFKPENGRRLAPCGITMMDSPIDVIPSVLHYLGRSPDSTDPADLAAVERTLMAIRPYIRNFGNGGILESLAAGETCLAIDYSGDVVQAAERAAEAKRGISVRYVTPKEGAEVGFDMLAIPSDAPHKEAALKFIDFLLRPAVMAGNTNVTRYPNAVPASRPLIRPDLTGPDGVFPTDAALAGFFTIGPLPQTAERARTRMWARFKAGAS